MAGIQLITGDITAAEVDAIVNAANQAMLGGGGVDGAIHRAAGPALLEACSKVPATHGVRCPTGEARITTAGNLGAKFVIHTVGPIYETDPKPETLLASAYASSLDLAQENSCLSIAFPAISCGVYGYPYDDAARIAITTCSRKAYSELEIYFYLYGDEIMAAWKSAMGS